jgi:hypothetical protein
MMQRAREPPKGSSKVMCRSSHHALTLSNTCQHGVMTPFGLIVQRAVERDARSRMTQEVERGRKWADKHKLPGLADAARPIGPGTKGTLTVFVVSM